MILLSFEISINLAKQMTYSQHVSAGTSHCINQCYLTVCEIHLVIQKVPWYQSHYYSDVIISKLTSQTTSIPIIYSTVDQRRHKSSASLAFVRRIHRWPGTSPHKGPVTRKMLPLNDVIMTHPIWKLYFYKYCRCLMGLTIWTIDSTIRHIFQQVSSFFRSYIYIQLFTVCISFFSNYPMLLSRMYIQWEKVDSSHGWW